ncbi:MAG TPA: hypothetical protein ENI86_04325, partial [Acidimicrobiales bacterium]|nr:hypothetical protein [Acidimicrobiales bacterium]
MTSHPTGGRRVGALFTVAAVWSWGLLAVARSLGGTAPSAVVAALRAVAAAGPLVATHVLLRRTVAYEQRTWFWRRYLEIRSVSRNWWAAAVLLASVPPIAAAGIDWSGWG